MTLLERARGILAGARAYRYEGEQANHADLLRERRVSLSMMATADPENPDQARMASEIEHDAENRLTVLLGKPRLTLEEKRERDAIQAALAARRQGFDSVQAGSNTLVQRTSSVLDRPKRFLGTLTTANPWLAVIFSPWTWLAVTASLLLLQTGRIGNLKDDVRDLNADVGSLERHLANERQLTQDLAERVRDADALSQQTARNLEAERARNRANAAEERRRYRDLRQVDAGGGPPNWEHSLRSDPVAGPPSDPNGATSPGRTG